MEKKGDLLNQMAIMSDMVENMILTVDSATLTFTLKEEIFNNAFLYFKKKYKTNNELPDTTFTITIGYLEFIFNKSNV